MKHIRKIGAHNAGVKVNAALLQCSDQRAQVVVCPVLALSLGIAGNGAVGAVIGKEVILLVHAAVQVDKIRVKEQRANAVRHKAGLL